MRRYITLPALDRQVPLSAYVAAIITRALQRAPMHTREPHRIEAAGVETMTHDCIGPLIAAGIDRADAHDLRRISMTLHRWHEPECGTDSYCIVRGKWNKETANFDYDDDGLPHYEYGGFSGRSRYSRVADRERGASLYILRPGDVPTGAQVDSCYSRGLAIYR